MISYNYAVITDLKIYFIYIDYRVKLNLLLFTTFILTTFSLLSMVFIIAGLLLAGAIGKIITIVYAATSVTVGTVSAGAIVYTECIEDKLDNEYPIKKLK